MELGLDRTLVVKVSFQRSVSNSENYVWQLMRIAVFTKKSRTHCIWQLLAGIRFEIQFYNKKYREKWKMGKGAILNWSRSDVEASFCFAFFIDNNLIFFNVCRRVNSWSPTKRPWFMLRGWKRERDWDGQNILKGHAFLSSAFPIVYATPPPTPPPSPS